MGEEFLVRLCRDVVAEDLHGEVLLCDTGRAVVHRVPTADAPWAADLALDVAVEVGDDLLVRQLIDAGLVEQVTSATGTTRRQIITRTAGAAAVAGVASIVLPKVAAAASGPPVPPPPPPPATTTTTTTPPPSPPQGLIDAANADPENATLSKGLVGFQPAGAPFTYRELSLVFWSNIAGLENLVGSVYVTEPGGPWNTTDWAFSLPTYDGGAGGGGFNWTTYAGDSVGTSIASNLVMNLTGNVLTFSMNVSGGTLGVTGSINYTATVAPIDPSGNRMLTPAYAVVV